MNWQRTLISNLFSIHFLFGELRIYSLRDFSFIFSLIFDDFLLDLLKNYRVNTPIFNGNGISTSFCVKKWYFHCPRENMIDWGTKECGNVPLKKKTSIESALIQKKPADTYYQSWKENNHNCWMVSYLQN